MLCFYIEILFHPVLLVTLRNAGLPTNTTCKTYDRRRPSVIITRISFTVVHVRESFENQLLKRFKLFSIYSSRPKRGSLNLKSDTRHAIVKVLRKVRNVNTVSANN